MKLRLLILLFFQLANSAIGQVSNEDKNLVFDRSDLLIIQKADSILSNPSKWNKQDERECNDDIATGRYSLFCALYKASIDITGVYIHRRAALEVVRFTVEKHDKNNIREHRLMDWNNSAKTTFTELKDVLMESMEVVKKQLN